MRPRAIGFLSRLKKRLKRSVVTTRPFPSVEARERRSQKSTRLDGRTRKILRRFPEFFTKRWTARPSFQHKRSNLTDARPTIPVKRLMLKSTPMIADNRGESQGVFGQLFANLLKFFLFFTDAGAARRCDFLKSRIYKIARDDVGFVAIIGLFVSCGVRRLPGWVLKNVVVF